MKAHNILLNYSRNQRRQILSAESQARKTGQWGEWEHLNFPKGSVGKSSWLFDFEIAHKNKVFSVLDRTLSNGFRHFAITSLSQIRPTWPEMQRIKDELAGLNTMAVEIYPPHHEIVDDADMYHIWILPKPLPVTLAEAT